MRRTGVLLAGLIGGVLLAGVGVGLLIPLAPERWRTAPAIWGLSAIVVALCVGAAILASRSSRD